MALLIRIVAGLSVASLATRDVIAYANDLENGRADTISSSLDMALSSDLMVARIYAYRAGKATSAKECTGACREPEKFAPQRKHSLRKATLGLPVYTQRNVRRVVEAIPYSLQSLGFRVTFQHVPHSWWTCLLRYSRSIVMRSGPQRREISTKPFVHRRIALAATCVVLCAASFISAQKASGDQVIPLTDMQRCSRFKARCVEARLPAVRLHMPPVCPDRKGRERTKRVGACLEGVVRGRICQD